MKPAHFRETPFSISPNPVSLYLTPSLRATLNKMRYTVNFGQGVFLMLGDNGLGKSSLCRYYHAELAADESYVTTLIPTPKFPTPLALLRQICDDLGIAPKRSFVSQQAEFQKYLIEQYENQKTVVVFIDEAQILDNKMLEMLRSFLNFETGTRKLIQIILAAQLQLKTRLERDENKPLRTRISTYSVLDPMTLEEVEGMFKYRAEWAGIRPAFTSQVIQRIYEHSSGVPRDALKIAGLAYHLIQQGAKLSPDDIADVAKEVLV